MSLSDGADADTCTPTIFGQSHELLAEVAARAAREAADRHVRAGRLAPERQAEDPNNTDLTGGQA